jgi:riboflavin biosynthesis pyrimidine reductase
LILDLKLASLPEIADHYATDQQAWVRANMIVSRDGHFVGAGDSSRDLTSESDLKLLLLLRALSDVVLVGANTARLENYRQPKTRTEYAFLERKPPRLAVVSSSLDFDLTAPLFTGGLESTIIINVGSVTPSAELSELAQIVYVPANEAAHEENFATRLISQLAELGLRKVTCEGGPSLLAQLLKARVVDEYDLAISPVVVGGTPLWSDAFPNPKDWVEVGSATADDFEFKRLIRS